MEVDGHGALGDDIKIVITVISDAVFKLLERRYVEDVSNPVFVQPAFNRSVHSLPVYGGCPSVIVTI